MIRRHRIEKSDGSFFAPGDFVVGDNVSFYGRTFHIVDADVFTRQTLADAGLEYGLAEPYPNDPFTTKRLSMQRHGSGQSVSMHPLAETTSHCTAVHHCRNNVIAHSSLGKLKGCFWLVTMLLTYNGRAHTM